MPIAMTSEDLAQRGARFVFKPGAKKETPAPTAIDPALTDAINKVAEALASGMAEQRAEILRAMSVTESLVNAMGQMHQKEKPGPWTAKVTGRDKLGRISEVEFTPR